MHGLLHDPYTTGDVSMTLSHWGFFFNVVILTSYSLVNLGKIRKKECLTIPFFLHSVFSNLAAFCYCLFKARIN